MGESLIELLPSFRDELEKVGFIRPVAAGATKLRRGLQSGAEEAVRRIVRPIRGLKSGWTEMSPRGYMSVKDPSGEMKNLAEIRGQVAKGGWFSPGKHLLENTGKSVSVPGIVTGAGTAGQKAKRLAEEASRRGITGEGRVTKYMPVGLKGIAGTFGAMEGAEAIRAPSKVGPTGEGGKLEKGLGALGSFGGMVLGGRLGFAPATALWLGGAAAGKRLGRVLDRKRSGASLGTAIGAPSREEALSELKRINKYYG